MGLMSQDTVNEETTTTTDSSTSSDTPSLMEPPAKKVETQDAIEQLPPAIKESVEEAAPKSDKEVNVAIFDGVVKDGTISTPKKGENPINWIAKNAFGLDENDPAFKKAFKPISKLDIQKQPWCAAFAGHILRGIGADLPSRAIENPELAYNYMNLGKEIYDHNPRINKTYAGSAESVKPGDIIVFNTAPNRQDGTDFGGIKGHISFVVGIEEDGSILALGGNQGGVAAGGGRVQVSRYTPEGIAKDYPGGYKIRRLTNTSLEEADPEIIAAITKDIAKGARDL